MTPTTLEPAAIPGVRKAAMFLLGIGSELSRELLRQLEADEIRAISTEIAALGAVAPQHMIGVFREFEVLAADGRFFAKGGHESARKLVEQALGADSARSMMQDPAGAPAPRSDSGRQFLEATDPAQLARFLKAENPQTIALVLSNMRPAQAGALMAALPEELRPRVALRMATLDRVSPDVFERITEAIGTKLKALRKISRSDGIRSLAALLNHVDGAMAESILSNVDGQEGGIAGSVRDLMFVFDDILTLPVEAMKALVPRVDRKILTIALKGTSAEIQSHFKQCLSQRAQEMLTEDMDALGPVRIRDVSAAQQQVVTVIRQLQREGAISIGQGAEDAYVV